MNKLITSQAKIAFALVSIHATYMLFSVFAVAVITIADTFEKWFVKALILIGLAFIYFIIRQTMKKLSELVIYKG